MFCTQCGTQNEEHAGTCRSCGHPLPSFPATVPNYLVQGILVTICCCVPFGIPAIVYAAQVNGKLAAGDVGGAIECSRKARMWSWIGFGVGVAGALAYLLAAVVGAVLDK
jgi:hypothetical protein